MPHLEESLRRSSDLIRVEPEMPIAWFNQALTSKYTKRLGRICQHRGLQDADEPIILRLDHSIGAAKFAFKIVEHQKSAGGLEVSDEIRDLVVFFSLCHDLGHGPFSHAFEQCVIPFLGIKNFDHEHYSVIFTKELAKEIGLAIPSDDMITDVICEGGKNSSNQLLSLISNKKFGLDVDRIDYLNRDAAFFGVEVPYTEQECLDAFYFDPSTPELRMMIKKGSLPFLNRFLEFRMKMYKEAYYSQNMVDFCVLITEIFKENAEEMNLKVRVLSQNSFFFLDDLALEEARTLSFKSADKELSQECFRRIDERRSFPMIGVLESLKPVSLSTEDLEAKLCEAQGVQREDFRVVDINFKSLKDIDPNFLVFDEKTGLTMTVSQVEGFELFYEVVRRIYVYAIREEVAEKLAEQLTKIRSEVWEADGLNLTSESKA